MESRGRDRWRRWWPLVLAAGLALASALAGCDPAPPVEEDLGPIEDVLDELVTPVWPGVEDDDGRHIRLLNGFFDGAPTAYWWAGFANRTTSDVFWFCREGDEGCPFDPDGGVDFDRVVGGPVFATMPGEDGYSPFWLTWVVTVPADYEPDSLKSVPGIEEAVAEGRVGMDRATWDHGGAVGPGDAIMLCTLVLAGTELQGNGDPLFDTGEPSLVVPIRLGWHKQYQVHFYEFTEGEGPMLPDPASESRPQTTPANIFLLYRDCTAGSTSPACDAVAIDVVPIDERGVEEDLNGDGDRRDTNNLISGFPGVDPSDPWDVAYSSLWKVHVVRVAPEHDGDVALVDTSGDQGSSDVMGMEDLRLAVQAGLLEEPIAATEEDMVDPLTGAVDEVFFNCPSQVADSP
jgi:hypothetical protein